MVPVEAMSIWFIVKLFILLGLVVYLVFSLVVVRQIGLMVDTIQMGFEGFLKLLGWTHLAFAIIVFVIALTIL